jgi:hypothetical protein
MSKTFLSLFVFTSMILQAQTPIPLQQLEGRWFIVLSNFPMWTKGNKTNPTFNYSITSKGNDTVLLDEVKYFKNGKEKSIVGYDHPLDSGNTAFVWRGKGLLSLLKSRWEILHLDSSGKWMIIHFQKTLFTPEGYDVVSRNETLTEEEVKAVSERLKALGIKNLTKLPG